MDADGYNSAHRACLENDSVAAILILARMYELDLDLLDEPTSMSQGSRTCLHIAASKGLADVVAWLLEKGAKPDLCDRDGSTAWELCTTKPRKNICDDRSMSTDTVTTFLGHYLRKEAPRQWCRELSWRYRHRNTPGSIPDFVLVDKKRIGCSADLLMSDVSYVVPANNHICILALVRWAIFHKYPDVNAVKEAVELVYDTSRESGYRRNMLMYREPGVAVVEDRTIREDPALSLKLGSIVMPYFYSASWGDIRRRKLVHSESAICRVGDGRPKEVHSPLTLDEYCHPWLAPEVLLDRNQDQVVWRYERSHIREAPTHDESELVLWKYKEGELIPTKPKSVSRGICDAASVLMVHQVWIYLVDDVFVFAFPEDALREAPIEKALSPRPVRFENGRSMRFRRTFNTLSTFHRLKSIVSVTAQVEAYLNENSPHDQTMAASDGKEYFRMISDIREELSMIFSVISQQEEVWREMNTILKHLFPGKVEPYMTERMSATTEYIQKLKRQIDGLDKDAERVQVSIPRILDLKRSCAGTKESHWTAVMDAPVFGLAVAIIISTPLSFVMARLAVPRDSFFMAEDLKRRLLQWMTGTSKIVSPIITAVGAVSAYRFFKESTRWCPAPVSWWMQKLHELRHNNAPRAEKAGRGSKEPDVGSLDGADVTARK